MSELIFNLRPDEVAWSLKKQEITSSSSFELEYITTSSTTQQVIRMRKIVDDLSLTQSNTREIYFNKKITLSMTYNSVVYGIIKHFKIYHHFICDQVSTSLINIKFC